ncbi:CopD family protein, partial [Halobium palmae]
MVLVDALAATVHLLFAGLWTGSVLFVTYAVLPTAVAGDIDVDPLRTIVTRLSTVSKASSLALLLSGGYMATTRYGVDSLLGSGRGHLVLAMVALWFVLSGLVETATSRMRDGLDERKVRTPARDTRRLFRAA